AADVKSRCVHFGLRELEIGTVIYAALDLEQKGVSSRDDFEVIAKCIVALTAPEHLVSITRAPLHDVTWILRDEPVVGNQFTDQADGCQLLIGRFGAPSVVRVATPPARAGFPWRGGDEIGKPQGRLE